MKKLLSILTLLTVGLGQSSDSLISVYTYPDFPIISNPQILPYGSDKVIVTGTNSNDEASNILFFIIDHDGNMINSTEYPDINYLIDFVTVPDGSYIIATNNELWKLIIIDNNFNFSILTNEFNGNELTSISLDEDNRLNVTTTEDSFSEVLQYNLNGELISYFNVYDPDQDTFINENFNHHIRTSNGGFLFANDSSVYKTDFQGHIEWINNDLGVSHIIDILENNGEFLVIGDQGLYYDFYQYSVVIWVDELGNEISSYIADYDNALNSCILIEDGFIFNGNYSYSFQILPIFIRFNQNLEEVLYYPFSGIDGYSTDIHRTNEIISDIKKFNLKFVLHSSKPKILKDVDFYIVDTFGETKKFHKIASTVFLGGSIINRGGQNPLEAARCGAQILHGPNIDNFKDVYKNLTSLKISKKVSTSKELASAIMFKRNKKLGDKIKKIGVKILKETINDLDKLIKNEFKKT